MDIPTAAGRRRRRRLVRTLPIAALLLSIAGAGAALEPDEPLPAPEGRVLLVVRGAIERPNVGDEAHLDRAILDALPRDAFTTGTPWSEEARHTFEGVKLSAVLEAVGAKSARFEAIGVDDYKATFEGVDLERYPVLIADARDGVPLTLRTLGPLRIVFPFDDHPELLTQANLAMSVWQLVTMDVR